MRFGVHVWPGDTPRSFLLFAHPQNGCGKMAGKHQVPIATKVVKFQQDLALLISTRFGTHVWPGDTAKCKEGREGGGDS